MKNNVGILLNTPSLGGAERSIIEQAALIQTDAKITFYIPKINNKTDFTKSIENYISESLSAKIKYFSYPESLYSVSRSKGGINLIKVLFSFILIFKNLFITNILKEDILWANGNKIGLCSYLYCFLFGYKKRFIWHFRDYPSLAGIYGKVWKVFKIKSKFEFILIGNSNSVSSALRELAPEHVGVKSIYNPTSSLEISKKSFSGRSITIGVASMLAPWKGHHEVLLMGSLYEESLKTLNISSINIYGADIYKTDGLHSNYNSDLELLLEKIPCDLINFVGLCAPAQIFEEIDILIHSSIEPEPFGRVISEAYGARVPVI
jgi:hypothetical protein